MMILYPIFAVHYGFACVTFLRLAEQLGLKARWWPVFVAYTFTMGSYAVLRWDDLNPHVFGFISGLFVLHSLAIVLVRMVKRLAAGGRKPPEAKLG